jgi:hypothetical protein
MKGSSTGPPLRTGTKKNLWSGWGPTGPISAQNPGSDCGVAWKGRTASRCSEAHRSAAVHREWGNGVATPDP